MYIIPIIGEIGKDFKSSDLLMHLNSAKESDTILLIIDSPGGDLDESRKMRKLLADSKKVLYSKNSGDVASAAVELFLAPPIQNRRFYPEKGQLLIHNPYLQGSELDQMGFVLDADTLESMSLESKKIEKDLVVQYSKDTGTDAKILKAFMDENTPLTTDQIEKLGFAVIEKHELKAVAYININKQKEMEQKEIEKKLTSIESLLQGFKNIFKHKALMVQDATGKEIDFGADITAPEQIVVGIMATVDGSPAEGDYTMADGSVYKFVGGELKEIVAAMDEAEALKKENEQLKGEIAEMKAKSKENEVALNALKAESTKQLKAIETEFLNFKNQYSKENPPSNNGIDNPDNNKVRKPFKTKE